jgi:hypothetical protein
MTPFDSLRQVANRRTFLRRSMTGLGALALASMLKPKASAEPKSATGGVIDPLHLAPKVKRVIFL